MSDFDMVGHRQVAFFLPCRRSQALSCIKNRYYIDLMNIIGNNHSPLRWGRGRWLILCEINRKTRALFFCISIGKNSVTGLTLLGSHHFLS